MIENGIALFRIETGIERFFSCLSGIRTFAMLHILLGHLITHFVTQFDPKDDFITSFLGGFLHVTPVAVDTFMVMTGMLLTRSLMNLIEKRRFNIPKLYLHRYLRTTPVLGILILIVNS